jgi:hypothetical protein
MVGISTVFAILRHFETLCVSGEWNHRVWSWPIYHQISLDTRNKNMYGLGMEISMIFEILGYFLFQGRGGAVLPRFFMTYIPSDAPAP